MTIGIKASVLKEYLNRCLIFTKKNKIGLNPHGGCIFLQDDKAYVNNGETGAIIKFPFAVPQPTLLFPFDLAQVVNNVPEDCAVTLDFNYRDSICVFKSDTIEIKIRLINPKEFEIPKIPTDLERFQISEFYQKVKDSSFCCHIDASLTLLQGLQIKPKSVNATDQRTVWMETCESPKEFILPKLLKDHVERLALEPLNIACDQSKIYLFYNDITIFGSKLSAEDEAPNIGKVFEQVSSAETISTVTYDKETLAKKLEILLALYSDPVITIKCSDKLYIQNVAVEGTDTEGLITLDVDKTNNFDGVIVNGELFQNGITRFSQFEVKEKLILFWNDTQKYSVSRRTG